MSTAISHSPCHALCRSLTRLSNNPPSYHNACYLVPHTLACLAVDVATWRQEEEVLADSTGPLRAAALSLLDKLAPRPSGPADGARDSEVPVKWRAPSFLLPPSRPSAEPVGDAEIAADTSSAVQNAWRESSSSRHSGRSVELPPSLLRGQSGRSSFGSCLPSLLPSQITGEVEADPHMQFLRAKVQSLKDMVSQSGEDAARLDVASRLSLLSQVCE